MNEAQEIVSTTDQGLPVNPDLNQAQDVIDQTAPEQPGSTNTAESHSEQDLTATLQETVVRFQTAVQKNPDFITTFLDQAESVSQDGTIRSFADLPITDLAAILIVAEQQTGGAEQVAQIDKLRGYVLDAPDGASLYYPEHYGQMNATEIAAAIIDVTLSQDALSDMTGTQIGAVRETTKPHDEELTALAEKDPKIQEALASLEQEWQHREGLFAAGTESIVLLENEIAANVASNDDKAATVTILDGETKTKVPAKKIHTWAMIGVIALSDSLLGTNNLSSIIQSFVDYKVTGPLLSRMLDVDPSVLYERFGKEKYAAMDGLIGTVNSSHDGSRQMENFFLSTLKNGSTFRILEQINPIHLKKIFAPEGSKKFGSLATSLFAQDNLQLNEDLVKKMSATLSAHQKTILGIQQTPAS